MIEGTSRLADYLNMSRQLGPNKTMHVFILSRVNGAIVLQPELRETMLVVRDSTLYVDENDDNEGTSSTTSYNTSAVPVSDITLNPARQFPMM